jgi:hypothetical protein
MQRCKSILNLIVIERGRLNCRWEEGQQGSMQTCMMKWSDQIHEITKIVPPAYTSTLL